MHTIPEISIHDFAGRLKTDDEFVILDVREHPELAAAHIEDPRLVVVPMSVLARLGMSALASAAQQPETELLVICHHGNRSGQVAAWLSARGWKRVFSVAGGIDEYARRIDPTVGSY